ncbi:MAG TPA: hypothetical protein VG322_04660 [Candidatus Acidoferrales bacterium]|nr:hypothetical protein [Candidatus Acidoferrales bacterium]
MRKSSASASTHKKVVVSLLDGSAIKGYLNPAALGRSEEADLLTLAGEHRVIPLSGIKSVHFVREFNERFELERKTFLSRPKLDGLWVRLRFRDEDSLEGIVGNNLLDMLDSGIQLTPPDLHGNTLRMFVPRSALLEMKVLGVVGVARRAPQPQPGAKTAAGQSKLFNE